jgi:hypothetical protein
LLVDEVYAEEIVDQVELLFIAHPVELARHLVVLHQLNSQKAGFIERFCIVSVKVWASVLFQPLDVALFVLKQLLLS